MTSSDIVPGGRYAGGKQGKIRVVDSIGGAAPQWVWWHWNSSGGSLQCVHIDTFVKWAKEKV